MTFRLFVIILLLLTAFPAFARAGRLTLGFAPGAARDAGLEEQARQLAAELTAALGEDVSVRRFDDQQTLDQWLNPFAVIDLGLVDEAFLAARPGKVLVLGSVGKADKFFVVARQGATGDFPQRVAAALSRSPGQPPPTLAKSVVAGSPSAEVVASSAPSGAARSAITVTAPVMPMVIGLTVTRDGAVRSPEQARQFAAQLGRWLGVPVRLRLLANEQDLLDWFARFRMLDLAVIDEPSRHDPLTGDYRPLQRLVTADGGSALLVARPELDESRLEGALRALARFGRDPRLDEILAVAGESPPPPVAETLTASSATANAAAAVAGSPPAGMPTPPPPPAWPEAPVKPAGMLPAPVAPSVAATASEASVAGEPAVVVTVVESSTPVAVVEPPREQISRHSAPASVSSAEASPVTAAPATPAVAEISEVPEVIAQPALPQELRPPGVPQPRPGRQPEARTVTVDEPSLLGKLQDMFGRTPKPPPLLPPPDPEPGVVYVVPFITLMVPAEVRERVFDQFVDALNQKGVERKLKFIILKQPLDKIDRAWLGERKYILGEIYGYVEDSGCCSTDLRTRARLTFYRAHLPDPALKYEYPVRMFFSHDESTLAVERQKLSDRVAEVLVAELLKAL